MNTLTTTSPTINNKVPSIRFNTSNPSNSEDRLAGYGEGTIWLNTSSKAVFVLTDNTTAGSPSWDEITETATAQLPLAGGTMTGALNFGSASSLNTDGTLTTTAGNDADGALQVRSGNAAQYTKISMGTNANKGTIGCPGASDTFFTDTAAGDLVLRADDNNNKIHLGAGTSGKAGMVVTEVSNVGKVGIGTASPGAPLEILDDTTSSANTGGHLRLSAFDGAAMGASHRLGVIEFGGAEDTGGSITVGARIEAMTDAAWSATENGTSLYFYTTDGNASQTNVLKIDSNKKSTFNGVLDITDTTDSSDDSGDTGALRVEGGASIAKKLYVGTDLDVDGTANLDTVDIDGSVTIAQTVDIDDTTDSAASATTSLYGALKVDGGIAMAKNLYVGKGLTVGCNGGVVAVSDNYALTTGDFFLYMSLSGAITVTIPTAQCLPGRMFIVKDQYGYASSYNISVTCEGSQTIDGSTTKAVVATNSGAAMLICATSSTWFTLGMNDIA